MYVCPHCDVEINTSTEICPHCGADLSLDAEPSPPKPLSAILTRWAIILGIVAVGLWGFLWFVMPPQRSDPAQQAEFRAITALNNARAALVSYSVAQPGGSFPQSLEPLGDPVRAAAQLAQSEGYQIQYTPRRRAPTGPSADMYFSPAPAISAFAIFTQMKAASFTPRTKTVSPRRKIRRCNSAPENSRLSRPSL
ncbi:MAG TPA: hypothetical protein VN774_00700 [Candidatus Limnocylindrales bacterium]|nr:hypothetical protein [Candidatus Limnocylindrales bacterium]